ncbi:MAG: hypothetical protein Kow0047_13210 [Anaerolineae bacterium]
MSGERDRHPEQTDSGHGASLAREAQKLVEELRTRTTWYLIGLSIIAAWVWTAASMFGYPEASERAVFVFIILSAVAGLLYAFSPRLPTMVAPALYLLPLTACIALAIRISHEPGLILLYGIPIFAASNAIAPWAGLLLAAVLAIGAWLVPGWVFPIPEAIALRSGASVALALTAGTAWLFSRDLDRAVTWIYESYRLTEQRTREAQMHRSKLVAALGDLDRAYYRLRRANEALAWARQQAEQAREAKARFVANVSHELRTPLNLIIGFSEMMVTAPESYGAPLPAAYRGDLNAIYRNAKHLSDLIEDVLSLSQIEADRVSLNREQFDLRQVVESAADMVRGMVEAKGLRLIVNAPSKPIPVLMDVTRIRQVVLNLLSNAARFTTEGGITVRVEVHDTEATVTVTDSGPGIAPEALEHVFEEFYQADDSIRREHGGTGLGLAISKRFVELHGGRIWAESQPGQGSTFGFSLPLATPASRLMRYRGPSDAVVATGDIRRILLVWHPDPSAGAILERHLKEYRVHVATSEDELLEAASHLQPTAVLVETRDRERAAACLQSAGLGDIPVVACPLPTALRVAQRLRVKAYLPKPVRRDDLQKLLGSRARPLKKILIADDDPAMVRLLRRVTLAVLPDVQVLQAFSGAAALDTARAERPDLILLDLLMPGMDGLQVVRELERDRALSDVDVVIITATEMGEDAAGLAGELTMSVQHPMPVSEWFHLLRAIMASLRPAPESAAATAPALA